MDLDTYDQPNILFLRGCFLGDCNTIEDLFDERLIGGLVPNQEIYDVKDITYDKIPKYFTCEKSWITKTNLKCWSCDCNFHNVPIFVPTALEKSDDIDNICGRMDVLGNFCSWNCASLYINTYFSGSDKWEKKELLKLLYKILTGTTITEIPPAPHKTSMRQYGGSKTCQEYMENLIKLNSTFMSAIKHNSISHISK